jgi:hypothetical protein
MSDDLEVRLREQLRSLALPPAPDTLRRSLADLPLRAQPVRRQFPAFGRRVLVTTAAFVVLALGVGSVILIGSGPSPAASIAPTAAVRSFEAPGITFEYPSEWADQSALVTTPMGPGIRFVALLVRGLPVCPASTIAPTPAPGSCDTNATSPGSLRLWVTESLEPLPGAPSYYATPTTVAGYPAWEETMSSPPADPATLLWWIQAPDGGLFTFNAEMPLADLAARKADIESLLASLRLSAWETPPVVVNGLIHEDLPEGFSFDYPAGWTVYFPQDNSTMDSAVVTVASAPVLVPCTTPSCQRFTPAPGSIVIEFRVGNGPTAPDWSTAPSTIGGQPAFREDWGPQNATGADEGHTWSVRLTDSSVLGIYLSLRGPNLPALRAAMDQVLASIRITRVVAPSSLQP